MPEISTKIGIEALDIQEKLLKEMQLGRFATGSVTFVVHDGFSGRVLRSSMEQDVEGLDQINSDLRLQAVLSRNLLSDIDFPSDEDKFPGIYNEISPHKKSLADLESEIQVFNS